MFKSWIRAGLVAGLAAFGVLLLRSVLAKRAPDVGGVIFAGGLYTVAFALRVSL